MKRTTVTRWTALISAVTLLASAAGATDLLRTVNTAKDQGLDPGVLTSELLAAGHAPARVAHAVADVWRDCAASQAAVAVAVTTRPEAATDIVSAVGTVDGCTCAQGGGWSRTRLDGRIRFDAPQRPVGLDDACSCLTAAVEAGVAAAPQLADRIVMASLEALQQDTETLDSAGRRGDADVEGWTPEVAPQRALGFRRKPDVCQGDRDDTDGFEPADEWLVFEPGASPAQVEQTCDTGERGLMITEFVADPNGAGYVQIFNGSDQAIDLAAGGHRLGVSYAGQRNHNVLLPLRGVVQPGAQYLVAARGYAAAGQADELVNVLNVSPGDAISLHRPAVEENCQCTDAVAGGALRGSTAGIAGPAEGNVAQHKMTRLAGINEFANGVVIDAVGQVQLDDQQVPRLTSSLGRRDGQCLPDAYELDAFSAEGWQPVPDWNADCALPESDLVISGFTVGADARDAVSLLNGSSRDVDLGQGGYFLEIYQPGARAPQREIALTGLVAAGETFLLADENATEPVLNQADVTLDSLSLGESSAVVLSRRQFDRRLFCRDPLAAFLEVPAAPVFFIQNVPIEGRDPVGEPPRVDPVASPN
ncbi:MAG: lamin tail domain-containing protein [Xanthomonadales bacterium]|nr:lamin tail domain-containing protein [Xanthomonadales bacterium]